MHHLYNSRGVYIASEADGYLYAKTGRAVGRYLAKHGIFVDLDGRYLGEIVCINRLVCDTGSRYRSISAGPSTYQGMITPGEAPKNFTPLPLPPGFEDIDLGRLLKAS